MPHRARANHPDRLDGLHPVNLSLNVSTARIRRKGEPMRSGAKGSTTGGPYRPEEREPCVAANSPLGLRPKVGRRLVAEDLQPFHQRNGIRSLVVEPQLLAQDHPN